MQTANSNCSREYDFEPAWIRGVDSLPDSVCNVNCCYASSVDDFLKMSSSDWMKVMTSSFRANLGLGLDESQKRAWRDCFTHLQNQLVGVDKNFAIVFEYILPYESGRRPDVLLISAEQVLVLEFKQWGVVRASALDQVAAYARDLREYHVESRGRQIVPILVLTGSDAVPPDFDEVRGVSFCSASHLEEFLSEKTGLKVTACDLQAWLKSHYAPLPTIVEAAKRFVHDEELPQIRRVNSTCIPQAIDCLKRVTEQAERNKEHVVAFVTGVPGAGKTFLGLQYVYDICRDVDNVNSVYLSGNGPLISVLTEALHSSVFVKDLHKVIIEFLRNGAPDFDKNVIVFDEGQRAWDRKQMLDRRNVNGSEPDVMIRLCDERTDWCVLLVLVGEGQEIHNGENSGVGQWVTAVQNSGKNWKILCPDKLMPLFGHLDCLIDGDRKALNLSMSLRSHLAGDVSAFVNKLIDADIAGAKAIANDVRHAGFSMYVTRNLVAAKGYLRERYRDEPDKRYGMIASSKGKVLRRHGMDNSFQGCVGSWYIGKWFNESVESPRSCCALTGVATEFACQGLELDMPLIGWDNDMLWDGSRWSKFKPGEPDDSDANTYRINSYRVLLTRGRDGFVIFVPPDPIFNPTYDVLVAAGIEPKEK